MAEENQKTNRYGTTSVAFGQPLLDHVRAMAAQEGVTLTEIVRTAVREYAAGHYTEAEFEKLRNDYAELTLRSKQFRKTTGRA
ncbi:hypothetical protein [Mesorhizobium sp. A623]